VPATTPLDLHAQERVSIERALERFAGNRKRAAEDHFTLAAGVSH
jgi:hypothetical protein